MEVGAGRPEEIRVPGLPEPYLEVKSIGDAPPEELSLLPGDDRQFSFLIRADLGLLARLWARRPSDEDWKGSSLWLRPVRTNGVGGDQLTCELVLIHGFGSTYFPIFAW